MQLAARRSEPAFVGLGRAQIPRGIVLVFGAVLAGQHCPTLVAPWMVVSPRAVVAGELREQCLAQRRRRRR